MRNRLPLAWRLARRELRGGVAGFRIFLACLALGVAAIAGANSLNAALDAGLAADARGLLGGDLALRLMHQPADAEQEAYLRANAIVSEAVEMRAMARPARGDGRGLVELKGVDDRYPLYGDLVLRPAAAEPLARRNGRWGAAADPNLLSRLGIGLGDIVRVGDAEFEIRATIVKEPDRVATILSLGPRLLVHRNALPETGLIQPGSLVRYVHLLKLPPGRGVEDFKADLTRRFPEAGWQIRDRNDAAPGVKRFLDNMTMFLTLVGLTALLIGGIGVANAVRAFIEGRIPTIAVLKCMGASSGLVFRVYFTQIALLSALGIAIGVAAGIAVPPIAVALAGDALPVAARLGIYPKPLLLAAAFGVLVALAFSLWPLARATRIPAAALFRDVVARGAARPGAKALAGLAATALALAALTVATAENRGLAVWFVGGAAISLALFRGMAALMTAAARRASRHRAGRGFGPAWRLGVASLHRPGTATTSVVLSLGLGLTVLVAIALVEGNLRRQLDERMPADAPAFFFLDIQQDQADTFDRLVASVSGAGKVNRAAMVRGRVVRVGGVPVERVAIAPEAEWVVRGDRGLTTAATPPPDSRIVAGEWWPADYAGPPLASMDIAIARGFGIGVGDTVTLNVLGRDITVTIASLREIDWSTLAMNFTFVLSPNALAGAPHAFIATLSADPASEDAIERTVTDRLPNVSAIRVRQALDSVREVMAGIGAAVRGAALVSLAAGALVLAGAIAAGHRRRVYEAVVLKVLGATRNQLLKAFVVEYGLLGVATGLIAGVVGSAVAWAVLVFLMRADWRFLPGVAAATVGACVLIVLGLGFAGTWRALGAKVAPLLRNE